MSQTDSQRDRYRPWWVRSLEKNMLVAGWEHKNILVAHRELWNFIMVPKELPLIFFEEGGAYASIVVHVASPLM